jgi:hypothetical protein
MQLVIPLLNAGRIIWKRCHHPTKPESQRKLGLAKWDDVMRIAGGLMLDTQMFPARFYVSKFPTDEQLAAVIQEQRL